jgi:hypothetical protein
VEAVEPPLVPPLDEQPASRRADAAMATAIEIDEEVFTSLPFWW